MLCQSASAGPLELSASFAFNGSNYGNNNYEWTRRYEFSVGYTFWGVSELEVSVQDITTRTKIDSVADTTFHDRIYSVDWVQSFTKASTFQPFVKVGIGQLNRDAYGTYYGGTAPPALYDSLTGVLGAGLRIYIVRAFSLKVEGTTYLAGGMISTWKDNFAFDAGFSIFL